jgi:hypothetical protein
MLGHSVVSSLRTRLPLARVSAALDDDDPTRLATKLRAFEVVLVLVLVAEFWLRAARSASGPSPQFLGHLLAASLFGGGALTGRLRRPAFALLGLNHAILLWWKFPTGGNHDHLELLFCLLAAFLRLDAADERRLYLRAVRWMVVVVFLFSGVQKLAHGYWVRGLYLAWAIGSTESFRAVLGPLLPPDEVARLASYRGAVGDGPYLVSSLPLLAVSNLTWITELALGPLLLWRATRAAAVGVAVVLLVAIELGAREVFFGLIFLDMIALFLRGDANRRLVVPAVVLLAALALSRLGWLPEITFL